jgi:hypothetical protein
MHTHTILAIAATAFLELLSTGCASHRVTLDYTDSHLKPPARGVQPVLEGSINGVSGHFVIDTGAMGATLTATAVQRCGIAVTPSDGFAIGVGGKVAMMQATNVTVRLAQDVTIHWPIILVLPKGHSNPADTNDDFFGILDYRTFAVRHAVMDMKQKTITLTK